MFILLTLGLCLTTPIFSELTIPLEEQVEVRQLSNGVKIYVQESDRIPHLSSFRVVRGNEGWYSYDGSIESAEEIELFFDACQGKEGEKNNSDFVFPISSQQMAVVAVGDFHRDEVVKLIERHFGHIALSPVLESSSIQIETDPWISKSAIQIFFTMPPVRVQTFEDVKKIWTFLILRELGQRRLEACARALNALWIHPHPHFFYPVHGCAYVSEGSFENLLSLSLWQVEMMGAEGFSEEEFNLAKGRLLDQLYYLASYDSLFHPTFLASYYAEQFLLGVDPFSFAAFLQASIRAIEQLEYSDLLPHVAPFFATDRRLIRIFYPHWWQVEWLDQEQIEKIAEEVSSLVFHDYSPSIKEERANDQPFKALEEDSQLPSLLVVNDLASGQFHLANNTPIIQTAGTLGSIEPYYQLPLNDKEKRIIRIIFTTMAEENIIQLALKKRTMEKKGKRVNHVHPLRFIGYIFSNPDLKACMRKIIKSSFKWDAFVDGFSRRMKEEYANNNLYKHIPGFCQEVGADPDEIARFIDKKDWEGLVKSLL